MVEKTDAMSAPVGLAVACSPDDDLNRAESRAPLIYVPVDTSKHSDLPARAPRQKSFRNCDPSGIRFNLRLEVSVEIVALRAA